ncbi:TPBGL protein, partial [Tricholaema leucomelas]|nr:TPBGL protein [Tricholaema leucomelas]
SLLPLAVPFGGAAHGGCPASACYCVATPQLAQCRYERLAELPRWVPPGTRNLSISGGDLRVLPRAAFRSSPALRLLRLTRDNLRDIEGQALQGLPALGTLDLSHNPLRRVAPAAFQGAPLLRTLRLNQALLPPAPEQLALALRNLSLRRLELCGNALSGLPLGMVPAGLEELDLRNNSLRRLAGAELRRLDSPGLRRLRLSLAANPWSCDCHLRPFLGWLRGAGGRVPDARSLRCAGPAPLRGVALLRLRPEALPCPSAQRLDTASYVFFGLALALIGLVFLAVLYLNRRGIGRWLRTLRDACRDQMEGDRYRYERDPAARPGDPGP